MCAATNVYVTRVTLNHAIEHLCVEYEFSMMPCLHPLAVYRRRPSFTNIGKQPPLLAGHLAYSRGPHLPGWMSCLAPETKTEKRRKNKHISCVVVFWCFFHALVASRVVYVCLVHVVLDSVPCSKFLCLGPISCLIMTGCSSSGNF